VEKSQEEVLWQTILGEIELTMSHATFATWFKPTELLSIQDQNLQVLVNNFFAKNQFEKKFDEQIKQILRKNGFSSPIIEYIIKGKRVAREETVTEDKITPVTESAQSSAKNPTGLNPKYRFDNFIVGTCNDLAHAASQAAAAMPGQKYNPIFIYGGSGLGKTHLIQAIGNEILIKQPAVRVLYASAETFGNEFIDYVRFKKNRDFGKKYRNVDVLIIDDIQFIAGKKSTQEEFFNTFNSLHQSDKQIILSSDKPPAEIPGLADRLRSRFQMGMAIDVSLPDYETRCAILEAKAAALGVNLPIEITEFLADQVRTNIRELEGALNQILAYCEMRREEPTLELAKGLLGDIKNSRPKHITARQIIDKTASYFDLKISDMCSPARDRHIAEPRQMAMYLLRSEMKMSFPKIARELGRKDHTTAIHSVDKIEREIKINARIREQISDLRGRLYV
jgi:chromosomal replication initiator protein